tara:strand:+ start:4173 stop:5183 length:1011 start_codon:yes stop_codon:yes gene_type:complete
MIPHNKPTLGKEEETAVLRVLRSGQLSYGDEARKFENEFCDFLGLPEGHAVAVSSGSSALFLAMKILFKEKETIAIPGYVCSALRNSIQLMKCEIEFLDVKKNSPNIDEKLIQDDSNPMIIPHMYGIPVNIPKLRNGIIIEDCSHAIGAKINDKFVGTIGEIGIFSFYVTKLMTSGGFGGMVVSNDLSKINEIRNFIEYDGKLDDKFHFNFQMGNLQAAIGREQLKKIPKFLQRREEIFSMYKDASLELIDVEKYNDSIKPVRFRALMKTSKSKDLIKKLRDNDIMSVTIQNDPIMSKYPTKFSNSLELIKNTISLPMYPSLSDEEVSKIISVIKN